MPNKPFKHHELISTEGDIPALQFSTKEAAMETLKNIAAHYGSEVWEEYQFVKCAIWRLIKAPRSRVARAGGIHHEWMEVVVSNTIRDGKDIWWVTIKNRGCYKVSARLAARITHPCKPC